MGTTTIKKLQTMKKKVGCSLSDCGQYFTFSINEFVLALPDEKKRIYRGNCSKCNKSIKLRQSQLPDFQSIYGQAKIVIEKSAFHDIFEEEQK